MASEVKAWSVPVEVFRSFPNCGLGTHSAKLRFRVLSWNRRRNRSFGKARAQTGVWGRGKKARWIRKSCAMFVSGIDCAAPTADNGRKSDKAKTLRGCVTVGEAKVIDCAGAI